MSEEEKDKEVYYVNKCDSSNQIERSTTSTGYVSIHQVEDKKVALIYNQYSDGPDDYYDELVGVDIL